jgi:hypothetical protein
MFANSDRMIPSYLTPRQAARFVVPHYLPHGALNSSREGIILSPRMDAFGSGGASNAFQHFVAITHTYSNSVRHIALRMIVTAL